LRPVGALKFLGVRWRGVSQKQERREQNGLEKSFKSHAWKISNRRLRAKDSLVASVPYSGTRRAILCAAEGAQAVVCGGNKQLCLSF
jgi:hypothetical protein